MSEKERELQKNIAALPEQLQDRFLDQVRGAALALDLLAVKAAAVHGPQPGQEKELRDAG